MAVDPDAKNHNVHEFVRDELDSKFENTIQSGKTNITTVSAAEATEGMGHATEMDWDSSEPAMDYLANFASCGASEDYIKQQFWRHELGRKERHFFFSREMKTYECDEESESVIPMPAEGVATWLNQVLDPSTSEEGFQDTDVSDNDPNEQAWHDADNEKRFAWEYDQMKKDDDWYEY